MNTDVYGLGKLNDGIRFPASKSVGSSFNFIVYFDLQCNAFVTKFTS